MMLRFVGRRAVARATLLGALGLLIASAGLLAAEPSAAPAERVSEATLAPSPSLRPPTGSGPMVSAMTPVSANPGYADQIVALGFDEATAAFMARTLSTLEVTDAHTFAVHHAFPNGATGDETYHLVQGSQMSPGDPPTMVYARSSGAPSSLPDRADRPRPRRQACPRTSGPGRSKACRSWPRRGRTTTPAVRLLGLAPLTPMRAVFAADAPSTVEVVVDGVISQGQETVIDSWADRGEAKGWTKTAKSWEAFKSGKKVWEAVEANDLIASALDKLKALKEVRRGAHQPPDPEAVPGRPE